MTTDPITTIADLTTLPVTVLSGGLLVINILRLMMAYVHSRKIPELQERICTLVEGAVKIVLDPLSSPEQRDGAKHVISVMGPGLLNSSADTVDPKKRGPGT